MRTITLKDIQKLTWKNFIVVNSEEEWFSISVDEKGIIDKFKRDINKNNEDVKISILMLKEWEISDDWYFNFLWRKLRWSPLVLGVVDWKIIWIKGWMWDVFKGAEIFN